MLSCGPTSHYSMNRDADKLVELSQKGGAEGLYGVEIFLNSIEGKYQGADLFEFREILKKKIKMAQTQGKDCGILGIILQAGEGEPMQETETREKGKSTLLNKQDSLDESSTDVKPKIHRPPLPRNTVRFEIISEGLVENYPQSGYIELDTLNNIWGFYLEKWQVVNLKKWNNNPYNEKNLYLDDTNIDYIIKPYVYEKDENRYYVVFGKYEACGIELRVSTKSAYQYFKFWTKYIYGED